MLVQTKFAGHWSGLGNVFRLLTEFRLTSEVDVRYGHPQTMQNIDHGAAVDAILCANGPTSAHRRQGCASGHRGSDACQNMKYGK